MVTTLEDERRWELIESAIGTISDEGHEWDADPADWVSRQRRSEGARAAPDSADHPAFPSD